jgi:uncharacterized membrane protein YgdD (TMEM256/DUF423 family)
VARPILAAGLLLAALAVAAGAFGAHGLERRLEPRSLALWETAARYLMYGGLALAMLGAAATGARSYALAAWLLGVGTVVFSSTVAVLALGGPRWLGAVTPLGGLLMILGLLAGAWAAWQG